MCPAELQMVCQIIKNIEVIKIPLHGVFVWLDHYLYCDIKKYYIPCVATNWAEIVPMKKGLGQVDNVHETSTKKLEININHYQAYSRNSMPTLKK